MSNKKYFSYVRVSTQRQGQFGTSLTEQKGAIERYAQKFDLTITKYFEERETAAKLGRPVFLEMLKALKKGKANGVIIHKIDRSARNLRDWADLGSLIDSGIEVHFASESLDLNSRGGRLSADIQAVVASDYIRNLREETKKGIYGRLKQGLFPFPAVIGYLDAGKGNPKRIDKIQAPLIKQAFELYSRGNIGLIRLADLMYEKGFRNKNGKKVTINGLSTILHNPFYIGVIRIEKTGEMFAGKHEPIISKALFDQVQAVFEGKNIPKSVKHFFVFRRQVFCAKCRNLYIAEKQKGEIYYRCHTRGCTKGTVREDLINSEILKFLKPLKLSNLEYQFFKRETFKQSENSEAEFEVNYSRLQLLQDQTANRLSKLADAYVDGVFDKETYIQKKNKLLLEEQSIKENLSNLKSNSDEAAKKLDAFLELINDAYLSYKTGGPEQKQELVKNIFSNCEIHNKNVLVKPYLPFQLIAERQPFTSGSPCREAARTFRLLFKKLFKYFINIDTSKSDNQFFNYLISKPEKIRRRSFPKINNLGLDP
ncbi:MAG TPA: recombinase family protein [Pyrinomonadaceae bacterium]|jgi:DNA invertase Pin-like site-specific DNA recombinase